MLACSLHGRMHGALGHRMLLPQARPHACAHPVRMQLSARPRPGQPPHPPAHACTAAATMPMHAPQRTMTVGMLRTPYSVATWGDSSVLILTQVTLPAYSAASSSTRGAIMRHWRALFGRGLGVGVGAGGGGRIVSEGGEAGGRRAGALAGAAGRLKISIWLRWSVQKDPRVQTRGCGRGGAVQRVRGAHRSTPGGPEVHQHGDLALQHQLVKGVVVDDAGCWVGGEGSRGSGEGRRLRGG